MPLGDVSKGACVKMAPVHPTKQEEPWYHPSRACGWAAPQFSLGKRWQVAPCSQPVPGQAINTSVPNLLLCTATSGRSLLDPRASVLLFLLKRNSPAQTCVSSVGASTVTSQPAWHHGSSGRAAVCLPMGPGPARMEPLWPLNPRAALTGRGGSHCRSSIGVASRQNGDTPEICVL